MKRLKEEFTRKGLDFKQIARSEKGALYEVTSGGKNPHYEVWAIKVSKAKESVLGGVPVSFDEGERHPSDEDFGKWAWSFTNYDKAVERFEEL